MKNLLPNLQNRRLFLPLSGKTSSPSPSIKNILRGWVNLINPQPAKPTFSVQEDIHQLNQVIDIILLAKKTGRLTQNEAEVVARLCIQKFAERRIHATMAWMFQPEYLGKNWFFFTSEHVYDRPIPFKRFSSIR